MRRPTAAITLTLFTVLISGGGALADEPRLLRRLEPAHPAPKAAVGPNFPVLSSVTAEADLTALAASLETGRELILDLAPGLEVRAVTERVWITGDESFAWKGSIPGAPWSSAVIAVRRGVLAGSVALGSRRFQILPGPGDRHRVEEVDPGLLPDGNDLVHPADSLHREDRGEIEEQEQAVPGKAKTVFNLLVFYTKRARDTVGGKSAIEALIELGVAETNIALNDSKTKARFRLKDVRKIGYKEKMDMGTDLSRLQRIGDGKLDEVHGIRDAKKADFVKLVVDRRDPNRCGIAYLSPKSSSPASFAFSVTRYDCISPNYTFGHELGHNLGLAHARGSAAVDPFLPFGWGYYEPDGLFRTVMATSRSGAGRRVLHFSNPKVRERGERTGVGHKKPDSADAARAVRNARALLASYR